MVHDATDWNESRQAEHDARVRDFRVAYAAMKRFHDAAERGDWAAAERVLEETRQDRARRAFGR